MSHFAQHQGSTTSYLQRFLAKRSEVLQSDKMGNILLESRQKQTPKEGKFHGGSLVVPTTHLRRIHHKLTQNTNFAEQFRCIGFVEFQDFFVTSLFVYD